MFFSERLKLSLSHFFAVSRQKMMFEDAMLGL